MKILETKPQKFQDKVNNAPLNPGVYKYLDFNKKIIYIGKAKNIRNRVKSYFFNFKKLELQKQLMIAEAQYIEFIEVDSEVDALILEANLIKKYHPRYNILMRDDKSYVYVRFEKVRRANSILPTKYSVYQDFPRITAIRNKKDDGADYFGPYPDSRMIKQLLRTLRKVFPFRTASSKDLVYEQNGKIISSSKKIPLEVHLGLTGGAEFGFETKKDYAARFNKIRQFFEGKKRLIIQELENEMRLLSKEMKFEEAARIRDKINMIKYATQRIRIDKDTDDIVIESLKKSRQDKAIEQLVESLEFPKDKLKAHSGFKIECYDISNFQGKLAVGAMTVAIDGKVDPSLYRRFRIRMKNEPNDFGMLQEVLSRRFRNFFLQNIHDRAEWDDGSEIDKDLFKRAKNWKEDASFKIKPDLIIIDGGKGQLASTYKILYNFGLHNEIPIVGLAKREEEIFKLKNQFNDDYIEVDHSSQFKRIMLPGRSESLYLVQRIRDEAHRFGITYHRNLRSKELLNLGT